MKTITRRTPCAPSLPAPPTPALSTHCACRTLPKTLDFISTKKADFRLVQGFSRQLQALDSSLQRVLKGSGGGAGALARRYSEWDPQLLS